MRKQQQQLGWFQGCPTELNRAADTLAWYARNARAGICVSCSDARRFRGANLVACSDAGLSEAGGGSTGWLVHERGTRLILVMGGSCWDTAEVKVGGLELGHG